MLKREFMKRLVVGATGITAGLPVFASAPSARSSPSVTWTRDLKIVVPSAPGGSADWLGRLLAKDLQEALGTSVHVENQAGGGGTIGARRVAQAEPDGYTLLLGSDSLALNAALPQQSKFDPIKALDPVAQVVRGPLLLLCGKHLGVSTVQEFMALARQRLGGIHFAIPAGHGSQQHFAALTVAKAYDVNFNLIPYKGGGPAMVDTIGGHIDAMIINLAAAVDNIRAGKLQGLAVTSQERSAALPGIPTFAEVGKSAVVFDAWLGLFFPKGVANERRAALFQALNTIVSRPGFQERMHAQGFIVPSVTQSGRQDFLARESEKYGQIALREGIRFE